MLKNNFKVFKTGFDLVLYSTNFSIYTISHDPQCIYSPTGWTMWSEVLQYFLWSNPFWWPITKCVLVTVVTYTQLRSHHWWQRVAFWSNEPDLITTKMLILAILLAGWKTFQSLRWFNWSINQIKLNLRSSSLSGASHTVSRMFVQPKSDDWRSR